MNSRSNRRIILDGGRRVTDATGASVALGVVKLEAGSAISL